ncbi:MAG: DNA cytosine methyltransferase [Bradymonadaceae bacterium]|nr:DNA cytosine methyltransferase [Lujinxingiaceae bacterium]
MPTLELYCGIGGFAAAAGDRARIVAAIDLSPHVLEIYRHNYPSHNARQAHLEHVAASKIAAYEAQMWWMSPPCQPYTTRGKQRDLDDHRAGSLPRMMRVLAAQLPDYLGMENVPGFVDSEAHTLVLETLDRAGYTICERTLCPTELGIPARRERYYLLASRKGLRTPAAPIVVPTRLVDLLEAHFDDELLVPEHILATHGPGMRLLDPWGEPDTVANTVTGAYGKTWQAAGAYLQLPDGRVRRFSPGELLRLLGFPKDFGFPADTPLRHRYKAVGNSLSVTAMREILRALPCFEQA